MGMSEALAKERKRNIDDGTEAYLVGKMNEDMKEDRKMVAPLLLHRTSSATTVQKAKNARGRKLVGMEEIERVWRNTDGEIRKNEKEGKVSPFIGPRKIKSRSLDYVQYELTTRGLETRLIVGIKTLFKNPNQQSRSG